MDFDQDRVTIAIPITGVNLRESEEQWRDASEEADLLEWRLDYLEEDERLGAAALARRLRAELGVPLLATYRTVTDGGKGELAGPDYRRVVEDAATWADLIDVEVSVPGSARMIEELREKLPVVASFHDFTSHPSSGITLQLLEHMQDLGAAVAKVAWMVRSEEDLEMVLALQQWAAKNMGIPAVVIGMGGAGTPSRLGSSALVSAFTFARGADASAPGQPLAEEIRRSVQAD